MYPRAICRFCYPELFLSLCYRFSLSPVTVRDTSSVHPVRLSCSVYFSLVSFFLAHFFSVRSGYTEKRPRNNESCITVQLPSVETTDQLCAAYRPPRRSPRLPSGASRLVRDNRESGATSGVYAQCNNITPIFNKINHVHRQYVARTRIFTRSRSQDGCRADKCHPIYE